MQVELSVPDGKSGDWEVDTFCISKEEAEIFNLRQAFTGYGRFVRPGEYKRLLCQGQVIMSNTSCEVEDHLEFIQKAKQGGRILINGLGLGVCLKCILESDVVDSVTVVEKSKGVIKLVASTYTVDERVEVIHADAYEYNFPKGVRYSAVWHDIWPTICSDNLKGMHRLHRKYRRCADWQGSWCRKECEHMRRLGRYV